MQKSRKSRKTFTVITLTCVFSTLLLDTGCQEKSTSENAVAQVRSKSISRTELAAAYGWSEEQLNADQGISEDYIVEAARKWASDEILLEEAIARHLDQDSTFNSRMEALRRELLINRLYEIASLSIDVNSTEIRQEYQSNREQYRTKNDQIELLYVIAPDRDQAAVVRKDLQDGKDLGEILLSGNQLQGEDLGWVGKEQLDPQLANAALGLVPGGISYPLKYDDKGYIILQCRQRRFAGTILPLEEIGDEVSGRVYLRKKMEAEKALRDSLWTVYNPKILINSTKSSQPSEK
ncbi:MAG: peptidylprolyl isomerase [bacterium]|nr:peptidylprolyl isomerase [bacterium]